MFEKMVEFQNKEISKAVLSVTLTSDVGTSGSYKASDVHRQILEYICISDKKIVEGELNQMFDYYTELNYGKNSKKILVKLSKKEAITDETAKRDKILTDIGVKFTKEYFKKKYNLGDEDFNLTEGRNCPTVSWTKEATFSSVTNIFYSIFQGIFFILLTYKGAVNRKS